MMLLSEIIGDCDMTQKFFSLRTFIVLPTKAKRTPGEQRKRKMGKVSRVLTELKAYIVYAVRGVGEEGRGNKVTLHCSTRAKIWSFLFPLSEMDFTFSGLRLFSPSTLNIITGIFNLKKSDKCKVITKKMCSYVEVIFLSREK